MKPETDGDRTRRESEGESAILEFRPAEIHQQTYTYFGGAKVVKYLSRVDGVKRGAGFQLDENPAIHNQISDIVADNRIPIPNL
jgi:hypothetical protein